MRCYIVIVFLFTGFVAPAQTTGLSYSRQTADTIFRLIQQQSMYRDQVNWDTLTAQFYLRMDTATSAENQFKQFRWLFRQLNDFHSQVFFHNKMYAYHKPLPDGREEELTGTYKLLQSRMGIMEARILTGQYGYICIPGFGNTDPAVMNATIKQWRDTICKKISEPVKGWIIDLRANMGGTMYPMMGSLGFLLGDIRFSGLTDKNKQVEHWWSIRNGDVYFDEMVQTATGPHCKKNQSSAPVVLLTSFYTVSSGEVVVTAFKERPRTLHIGDTTGGLVTGNQWIPVGADAALNLSKGYYTDRTGKEYRSGIAPDIVVKAKENFQNLPEDPKIQAAIRWLKEQR